MEDNEGTRVDLGDDLLETHSIVVPEPELLPRTTQDAQILYREGFREDAKRALHQILRTSEHSVQARKLLEEIHEAELREIFHTDTALDLPTSDAPTLHLLRDLDRDLGLGINERPSLFADPDSLILLQQDLDRSLTEVSWRDHVDIGIGFLEMGITEIALNEFDLALRRALQTLDLQAPEVLSVVALKAYALVVSDRGYEAVALLQDHGGNSDLPEAFRVEATYLLGRAYESMGGYAQARECYLRVQTMDPHYRDLDLRLRAAGAWSENRS